MLTMMPMAACDGSNADPILPEQPGQPGNSDGGDEDDSTNPTYSFFSRKVKSS